MNYKYYIKHKLIHLYSFLNSGSRSKVIFYHDLHSDKLNTSMSTHIELFKQHINIIKDLNYEIVQNITSCKGQVQICFDDGYSGIYEFLDIIRELDVYINLFVISSKINCPNFLSKQQLRDISLSSYVNIQSHTHTHRRLNLLSHEDLMLELKKSKELLEDIVSQEVDSLCFPEGRYNSHVVNVAFECDYTKLYSSLPGFSNNLSANKIIRRSLVQHSSKSEFKSILNGGDNFLYHWYKLQHKS